MVPAVEALGGTAAALAQEVQVAEVTSGAGVGPHRGRRAPAGPAGVGAAGHGLGESHPDRRGDGLTGRDGTRGDRCRVVGVGDGTGGGDDVDRFGRTGVVADVRVDAAEQGQMGRGDGVGDRAVDEALGLLVALTEVEGQVLADDLDRQGDPVGAVLVDAVVVEQRLGAVLPVGNLGYRGADLACARLQQLVGGLADGLRTVLLQERLEPPFADRGGPDLAVEHALHQGAHPHVGQDEFPGVTPQFALLDDAGRRDADSLLQDVPGAGVEPDDTAATDVDVVSLGRRPEDELTVPEDRPGDGDVRQMRAAVERVVVDEDVAVVHVVAEELRDGAQGEGRRPADDGNVVGLREQPAVGAEERGREVAGFHEDGRAGRAQHRLAHLAGDAVQGAADHGHENGVGRGVRLCHLIDSLQAGRFAGSMT